MKIFWSWQSDTPGKTGRHFIRGALLDAINELREPEDIEEPSEREMKDALHVDQDRQDVSGSPDLAPLILEKISHSAVFVADVTPVSTIRARKEKGTTIPEKRNMNPNVAIELGYALRALTDRNVLMVLNTFYGDRTFLPFDLAHKAGPITFHLDPSADASSIKKARAQLKGQFVVALRPFLGAAALAAAPVFPETPTTLSPAVFFDRGEVLGAIGEEHDAVEFLHPDGNGFYLRLIPASPLTQPFTRSELIEVLRRTGLYSLWRQPSGLFSDNRFGAVVLEPQSPDGGPVKAITQLITNGEIWGFAPWLFVTNEYGKLIPGEAFETVYRDVLKRYLDFMRQQLSIDPPYTVEAGAVGLKGFHIATKPPGQGAQHFGPFYDNEFKVRVVLNDDTDAARDTFLLKVFNELYRYSGYKRPAGLFGFLPATE